jgi:hypothetical protein
MTTQLDHGAEVHAVSKSVKIPRTKNCTDCHRRQPLTEYFRSRHSPDGLNRRFKSCCAESKPCRHDLSRRGSTRDPISLPMLLLSLKEKDRAFLSHDRRKFSKVGGASQFFEQGALQRGTW